MTKCKTLPIDELLAYFDSWNVVTKPFTNFGAMHKGFSDVFAFSVYSRRQRDRNE